MASSGLRVLSGTTVAEEPTTTLVDANVFLDIATRDVMWANWSRQALKQVHDDGRVVINPIVYAEVSVGYDTIEALDQVLPPKDYERENLPYSAGFLAGKAFLAYRKAGGTKASPIADFYIGAHAATRSYRLLTRDVSRYRTYFPTVPLIAPDAR